MTPKSNESDSTNLIMTKSELKKNSINVPATKLSEIVNDVTDKYKAEYFHTPPGMKWRYIDGEQTLVEMPKKKKYNTNEFD